MEVVSKDSHSKREIVIFGVLVGISLILIFMGDLRQIKVARAVSMVVFYPFEKSIAHWKGLSGLSNENAILRQKVTELSIENQQLRQFEYENKNLRKLVDFKKRKGLELVPAEVIGRDPNRLTESFVIDRGRDAQLRPGMPVVTAEGLVGKISEVVEGTSLVQTIFDRDFRVSCLEMKSRVIGILKWKGGSNCSLENVPVQAQVSVGDTIVSSGLGGIFPKGLLVGVIVSMEPDNTGLFHDIKIAPAADFSSVEEVFVVKSVRLEEMRRTQQRPMGGE